MDLISVIVPVYKVEPYLDRCVQSIVNQTYTNLEIILVDDGSPDNCGTMCDAWAEKDSRIRVIHKENGGLSDARNAGMAVATGEYIGFVDSDDWVDIRFFQSLYTALIAEKCDIAECGFTMTSGATSTPEFTNKATVCTPEEAITWHVSNKMFQQIVWNKLYRRKVITVEFEKGKIHEDEFWTYQIIANCRKLIHIDQRLYYYFQRENSIMGGRFSIKRLDALEAKVRRLTFLREHYSMLSVQSAIDLTFSCIYHGQLALKDLNRDEEKQVFDILERMLDQCDIPKCEREKMRVSHQVWFWLAKTNLHLACRLRNILQIGF